MMRTPRLAHVAIAATIVVLASACGTAGDDVTAATDAEATGSETAGSEAGGEAVEREAGPHADGEPMQSGRDAAPAPQVVDADAVTAYVVGYHWGYVLFEEDGTELDVLEVPVGTEVELVAVNDHASNAISQLPDAVVAAIDATKWHDRAHHDLEMGRLTDPEAEAGMGLSEALAAAHDGHDHTPPQLDHGLMVTGVGVEAFLDAHADEPERLVFTVEREGVHQFRCNVECGVGHESQSREMLVVTA
jgi:heme/copper-type cytochrome/quinol oxidase subunit 2